MRRLRGPGANQVRDIDRELLIGRTAADVEIGDPEVSRRHALIRPLPAGVEIEDLGSSNGTYVDGQRITGTLTLTRNASVRVGTTELTVEIELPQATRVSPARTPRPGDATGRSPVHRPEVTVARPQPVASGLRSVKRLPLVAGGLVVAALGAVALILLLGGASKPSNRTASATTPHCAARFPTVINDGFPEPPMRFSRGGVLDTTLRAARAQRTVNHHKYAVMEYDGSIPGPTLVICPGDRSP